MPTRVPKDRPRLTVAQINREGVVFPQIPDVADADKSLGARALRDLAAAHVKIVVNQDAVRLFDPTTVAPHLLGLFQRHYDEIVQTLRPVPPPDEVQASVEWLREFATPTKAVRERETSYQLKQYVNLWFGRYVWTGAFIVAAIQEGYAAFETDNDPHDAVFNISAAAWHSAVRRCENEGMRTGEVCHTHPMHPANRDYRTFKSYKPRVQLRVNANSPTTV